MAKKVKTTEKSRKFAGMQRLSSGGDTPVPKEKGDEMTRERFQLLLQTDPSLDLAWKSAKSEAKPDKNVGFFVKEGLLFRRWHPQAAVNTIFKHKFRMLSPKKREAKSCTWPMVFP